MASNVFINEIHYDNDGTDTGEAIEIAGLAGIDLTGWNLILYNGENRLSYNTRSLNGFIIPNQQNGFGTLSFAYPTNGIQNGSPDGIALVDNNNNVVQFLSYEGSFTALDGAANGLTSTDIGVAETASTPIGFSLQLTGTGSSYTDFTWNAATANTFGAVNTTQSFTSSTTNPVINEFVFNHVGTDTNEYVEIFGSPNTDYSSLWLLQIEGDSNSPIGSIDSAFQLGTTNASGYFFTGFLNSIFENGTVTLALVEGFTGSVGTDLDTHNDGIFDVTPWTNIVDDVAISDGGSGDRTYSNINLSPNFDGGTFTPGGASRIPNGVDTNSINDWVRNDFDLAGIPGFNGTPEIGEALNTPGAINQLVEAPPEPPQITRIYDIQGASHTSSLVNNSVTTTGIVTAIDSNGFYLQDASGDNNEATSDGIFIFTSSRPSVSVGDELQVTGTVTEFIPGGANTGNLSITQIINPVINQLSTGNSLPNSVIIGVDRIPPTENIDDDNLTSYDPTQDGIDFYESLEGMRVTVKDALAVSATNDFREIFTVANNGVNATGLSDRNTINISPDDFNPERIQIQFDSGILPGFEQIVDVGAKLGDVTGVVGYNFGNYEVNVTESFTPVQPSSLQREITNLVGTESKLTVGNYNVENLDPNDADGDRDLAEGKFAAIATQIVNNLKSPDIVALQEIQDNDGSVNSSIVDASQTYQTLIDAIVAAGGPRYQFVDVPPDDDESGGQPGGNIRVGYLYNPDRVGYVAGSAQRVEDTNLSDGNAFEDSRIPLAAKFIFNGQEVTVINNHFASKGGSTPLFGQVQPPINGSQEQREAQAEVVNNYVKDVLATDPNANVVVLGDFNEFEFLPPLEILAGDELTNLTNTLPENERYSYIFEGNSQSLDHLLVSNNLVNNAEFDAVHINAEFSEQASDHDPLVVRLHLAKAKTEILGTRKRDVLIGTDESERIIGFEGNDILTSGGGEDDFVYTSFSDRLDRITDFEIGKDKFIFTQLLDSLDYTGSDPIADGYLHLAQRGFGTHILIDPDGFTGNKPFQPFIAVEGVNVSELANSNSFLF